MALLAAPLALNLARAAEEAPTQRIEPATGHKVIRLSREPGTSSFMPSE